VEEIKAHPYFAGFNWDTVRESVAAHVPQLQSITDTSYFPTEDLDQVPEMPDMQGKFPTSRLL
jgi:protein-serine/threonine kinase